MNKSIGVQRIITKLRNRAPTILSCIAAGGVIATTVLAIKATPKAVRKIDKAKEEKGEDLTALETVKEVGTLYIPTAIIGTSTIMCVIGSNMLNRRSRAALMSAYALVDSSYKEYRSKLKELYGEEAHRSIMDAIAVEKAKETYVYVPGCISDDCCQTLDVRTSKPVLFYDEYGNRFFEATIEQVITAEYHLNRNFTLHGCAVLNELYDFLGIDKTEYGKTNGWSYTGGLGWIDFNHPKVTKDGMTFYILEMPFGPDVLDEDEW